MSGFCEFCQVWHSASCCHPGRPIPTAVYGNPTSESAKPVAEAAAYKWAYEYLQSRMESIGRDGWAHDCDGEIEDRIRAASIAQTADAREGVKQMFNTLQRLRQWDMWCEVADGKYWVKEIDAAIAAIQLEESK